MILEFFKIIGLCITVAIFCLILKPKSAEFAFLLSLGTGVIILAVIIKNIAAPIKEMWVKLSSYGVETEYFKVALKAVGLAYITDFVADACREAGMIALASKAEFAGKTAIFILSVPLFMSVLETAVGFIK